MTSPEATPPPPGMLAQAPGPLAGLPPSSATVPQGPSGWLAAATYLYGFLALVDVVWVIAFIDCDDCVATAGVFFIVETVILLPFVIMYFRRRGGAMAAGTVGTPLSARLEWAKERFMAGHLEEAEFVEFRTRANALIAGEAESSRKQRKANRFQVWGVLSIPLFAFAAPAAVGMFAWAIEEPWDREISLPFAFVFSALALAGLAGIPAGFVLGAQARRQARQLAQDEQASLDGIELEAMRRARESGGAPRAGTGAPRASRATFRRF